ncbi:MAG: GGDEF domain-containing protein [Fimbriimonadaceae bacterium]
MHTVESIRLVPVWVNPEHMIATARLLMAGHRLKMLAVLDGQKLIGTISSDQVAGIPENTPVSAVISPLSVIVPAGMSVRDAAELFINEHVDAAPVMREDRFIGMLTSQVLLKELKHSWDPLTSLPWSDRLRDWGTENLKHGNEITILFFDIDGFGLYNKKHGHVVGDLVLKKVAEAFTEGVESDTDVLVRYGGDEFAVGTTRPRHEAEALGASLMVRAGSVFLDETEEPVTMCMGLYGGKRGQERENVHYAATLDNLINLASKDCLSKKKSGQQALPLEKEGETVSPPREPSGPAPQIVGVYSDENSPNSLTIVILNVAGTVISGVHQRAGKTALQSIAAATGKALQRIRKDTQFVVEDILMVEDSMGEKFLSVTGKAVRGDQEQAVSGILKIGDDLYRSAVDATIHAFQGEM